MSLASNVVLLAAAVRDKFNAIAPRLIPTGGTTGQVLSKTSNTNYDVSWTTPAGGSSGISDLSTLDAAAPAADISRLFRRTLANRHMPGFIDASGLSCALQPLFARNKVGYWCPAGNVNTVPGVLGFTPFTTVGTLTARNVATTNLFTRMRRLGFVSASTAASLAVARVAVAQITLGTVISSVNVGGFFKVIRFGCSDAATVAGARQFVGVSSNVSAPTNVEPSTLTNSIGVGHGAADTNLKLFFGGSAAQTAVNLGVNFPVNTLSVDVYELILFCAPGSGVVYWQVTRLNTGHTASGTLTAANAGVQLPAVATLLNYSHNWRCNNATALAVGLDIFSDYIETDN